MRTTRRRFVQGTLGRTAFPALPATSTRRRRRAARTIRAVMQGDLRSLDPIWTTANITAYHGAMIYDTLFALDEQMRPQPQMVSKWGLSDDKLTYTFELRDGLKFSDGAAVTADDVVASIRRWAARDGAGQHMMARVKDLSKKDDKTFVIALREPYGLIFETMAKTATPILYIMRKKEAETDPNQQITEYIGSGPFTYNRERDADGLALRLRPHRGLRAAFRACDRHGRRQDGQGRPRHLREHAGLADRAAGAEGRRDRLLRNPADRPDRPAGERPEHQDRGAQQDRQLRDHAAQLPASRRSTSPKRARPCST